MNENTSNSMGTVIYLTPADARAARLRGIVSGAIDATRAVSVGAGTLLEFLLMGVWHLLRLVICALLVLLEPLLRITLVPLAFLSFLVTLIFGFLIGDPHFPKWGMLAFSVGALLLYWLFIGIMSLFMRLPSERY